MPAEKAEARVTYDRETNVLWIDGQTTTQSWNKTLSILLVNKPKYIMMEGPGGEFYAGLAIGALLEDYHVVITGNCVSACAAAALGAKEISFLNGAGLMFHGPFIPQIPAQVTFEEYHMFIVKAWVDYAMYLTDKGVSLEFVKHMANNTSICAVSLVNTQEALKLIKQERYPTELVVLNFCRK